MIPLHVYNADNYISLGTNLWLHSSWYVCNFNISRQSVVLVLADVSQNRWVGKTRITELTLPHWAVRRNDCLVCSCRTRWDWTLSKIQNSLSDHYQVNVLSDSWQSWVLRSRDIPLMLVIMKFTVISGSCISCSVLNLTNPDSEPTCPPPSQETLTPPVLNW